MEREIQRYRNLVKQPSIARKVEICLAKKTPLHVLKHESPYFKIMRPQKEIMSWLQTAMSQHTSTMDKPTKASLLRIITAM